MAARRKQTSKDTSGSGGSSKRGRASRLELALAAVARAAKSLDATWYLFGAQAVALHGVPRTTADVDVTILWNEGAELLVAALARVGIRPLVEDAEFIHTTRVIPAMHEASGWRFDVVLGGPGLEEHIAAEAVTMKVGDVEVPVLKLDHLVVLKVLAHRPQDLADVARLIEVRADAINFNEVRELLASLEIGLGESGLVSQLDELRGAATPARSRRQRK